MNTKTEAAPSASARKPWLSLFFATAGGAGYLPAVPGTWGSLVGVALYCAQIELLQTSAQRAMDLHLQHTDTYYVVVHGWRVGLITAIAVASLGIFVAGRVSKFKGSKDPQIVVIDEVSGQFITYLLALAPLNWKYLLLGFILFRGFDVWKPFPARQAEALPGGWGIMADDWIAGIYAAIGLWIARGFGL